MIYEYAKKSICNNCNNCNLLHNYCSANAINATTPFRGVAIVAQAFVAFLPNAYFSADWF